MLGHIVIVVLLVAVGVVLVRISRTLEDLLHEVRRANAPVNASVSITKPGDSK